MPYVNPFPDSIDLPLKMAYLQFLGSTIILLVDTERAGQEVSQGLTVGMLQEWFVLPFSVILWRIEAAC